MSILDQINFDDTEVEAVVLDPFADAPTVHELRKMYESYIAVCSTSREEAFRDHSYFDGDGQIGTVWREKLSKFNLPAIYINKIKGIVEGHLGVVLGQQVDPEALPRKESDVDAAAVATKILRYAVDKAKWKQKKADGVRDNFIMGISAVLVECSNTEVMMTRIPFREFCYDPFSDQADFSDANWLGFTKWMTKDQIKELFPESKLVNDMHDGLDIATITEDGFARENDTWVDKKNRRIQTVNMYYRDDGRWFYVSWCHAGILDWYESPYQDADGRSLCPLVPMSCYIHGDPEKKSTRYGIVRDMINPQDEYNAHRAQSLQHTVSRRVQRISGDTSSAYVDEDTLKEIAADPRGVLPAGYQMVPDNSFAEQFQLLQLAESEMSRMGPTPAVLGRSMGASESGRSRQVQAAAGLTEIATILDRVERWEDAVFRMVWNQVRQYWTEEMYIRVTGQDKSYKMVQINAPIIDSEMPEVPQPVMDENGQPVIDQMGQVQVEMVPNIVGINNQVSNMDMDIIVTVVPENANLEHETWNQILQYAGQTGIGPGDPRFIMMLKVAPLTNRNEIIEKMEQLQKEMDEKIAEQQQAQMQQQMEQMMLAQQAQQVSTAKDAAQADKYSADAEATRMQTQMQQQEGAVAALVAANLGDPGTY